jgi:hypothetical protein
MPLPRNEDRTLALAEGRATYIGRACYKCNGIARYTNNRRCVACQSTKNRKRGPELRRADNLKHHYAMTPAIYDAMLKAQGGTCAICDEVCPTGKRLAVDHDHVTDDIRGLLCVNCNTALGKMGDNPTALRYAADYIDGHRATRARVRG